MTCTRPLRLGVLHKVVQVTYITFFFVQHTGTLGTVYEMLLYISLSMGIFYSSELDQGPCQHAVTC